MSRLKIFPAYGGTKYIGKKKEKDMIMPYPKDWNDLDGSKRLKDYNRIKELAEKLIWEVEKSGKPVSEGSIYDYVVDEVQRRIRPLTEDEKEVVYDIINGIRGIIY